MAFNITSGPTATAQKVVLYGVEGIGKSTFASQFPSPIFIDTEGSTSNMNVQRLPKPTSWQMLMDEVDYVRQSQVCQTLIIDTADWADYLCQTYLCAKNKWESIESPGYGQGYVYVREEFGRLLNKLSDLTEMGINIILTAHTEMKKEEKADEFGKYDHYQLKMSKYAAALVKEWADMVLFANFETTIITDSKTKSKKAVGGNRVIYTTHHPAWDAKNRHNLPDKLPLEFGAIAHVFQTQVAPPVQTQTQPPVEQPQQEQVTAATTVETPQENNFGREPNIIDPAIPKELAQLMSVNEVTEEEIRRLVAEKGFRPYEMPVKDYPDDLIQGGLVAQWDKIFTEIKAKRAY
ncbi:ATP-binding protein [Lactococcus lactis]|uniref:ATP-binding protein n=1 Tax=Lactococcus lactis TaxID=1358 RepID=UPI0021A83468|nr:ATP-binding protein [Lactococcus lactis]MCT3113128.1 ATP-binding protein [Lactococcus lactis]